MFKVPDPPGFLKTPYMKDRCRITKAGDVEAPTKPGLGYELDRNILDSMTIRVERCGLFQAEDGIRDIGVTGVQTCALPICFSEPPPSWTSSCPGNGARRS